MNNYVEKYIIQVYNGINCKVVTLGVSMKLYINTLGEFDIKSNEQSILMQSSRTYKLYKLFEYFLTFRNKKLLPENIIDNLLSESESGDPKNMLRTQIFRLRKIIKTFTPKDEDESKYININFTNGYYCLEVGENVIIDVDEFEELIKIGDLERENNIKTAIENYEKAIVMYKGVYLSDNAYEVWLVPTRNYYQRLYQKTLLKLIELLRIREDYENIISLCEKALLIDPYDEYIHENLIESMINLGQYKSALNHHEYAYKLIEKEMDAKPSTHFINFINNIQNQPSRKNNIDIDSIKNDFDEGIICGALCCDLAYFKVLYNLEKRKSSRKNENNYLCIINCTCKKNKGVDIWSSLLEKTLRKGDVFAFWNENQILILLYNVKENGINIIIKRIYSNIENYPEINKDEVKIVFQPIYKENESY